MSEMVIQQLLAEAGFSGFRDDLVSVDPQGPEVAADWSSQESPETYLGYERGDTFASPGGVVPDAPHRYASPTRDRKSTRLNSSHRCISYAVFCLKKKT